MNRGQAKQRASNTERETVGLEELNLVEFPLSLLSHRVPDGQKTIEFHDTITDRASGELLTRTVIVTAADKWGLPTAQDMDVLLALIVLTNRKHGFRERRVDFSLYEVIDLLGWPQQDGRYVQRLKTSFDRWFGVSVQYVNAWRKDARWSSTSSFHIIDNAELTNTQAQRNADEPQHFKWNDRVVESINASHTKGLDWSFYIGLEGAITKRLYRFLDKRWKLGRRWSYDLVPFCEHKLGMRGESYRPTDFKKKLWPAIEELIDRGVLQGRGRDECITRISKGVYRVNFEQAVKVRRRRRSGSERSSELGRQLKQRGLRHSEQVVTRYPETRIRDQLANFDHRRQQGEQLGPGWLRRAIEAANGYSFRKDFVAPKEHVRGERKRLPREQGRKNNKAARIEVTEEEEDRIAKALASMSHDERTRIELQAIEANPLFTAAEKAHPERISQRFREAALQRHVKQLLRNEPRSGMRVARTAHED